ncbi:hypothetical protein NDU88_006478 [Pleurodeles waltl]|uniref:Uncharacterized protein n=1 Tax=Pleurodeles waltl TaxID=8319 RepID=A0AAV7TWX5_PLEWA|nr:hypothetical protein NDU88_006478 [Pleurodeles waltl]
MVETLCSGSSSVDATRRYPGGTSTYFDGPGNTSGTGLDYSEETSWERRKEEAPHTDGLLKSPGHHGEGAATADAVTRGAEDEGQADRDDEDSSRARHSRMDHSEASKR